MRMTADLNGIRSLEGICEQTGDFNCNGSIDITDPVAEAQRINTLLYGNR